MTAVTIAKGDKVTCDRLDGVWTVGEWEDDDVLWLVGPGPADPGGSFLDWMSAGPAHELVSVWEIRPVEEQAGGDLA